MNFDEIYHTYLDTVYSFLKYKLRDEHLVEEVVQETFLAVYKGLAQLEQVDSVKAWLLSIAHHKMVDAVRKQKIVEVELEDSLEANTFVGDLSLQEMLYQLDEPAQTIIYSLYVEQLTCKQIASIVGIPEGTVKSKAFAARAKLRSWLKEEEI